MFIAKSALLKKPTPLCSLFLIDARRFRHFPEALLQHSCRERTPIRCLTPKGRIDVIACEPFLHHFTPDFHWALTPLDPIPDIGLRHARVILQTLFLQSLDHLIE